MKKNKINLLNDIEIEELYSRPKFNDTEREYYFQLDEIEFKLLKKYTNIKSKIFLILQIGFFRAKQQFYKFKLDDVSDDVDYVIKKYYSSDVKNKKIKGQLWKENYRKQKNDILKLYGYREWSNRLVKPALKQLEKLIRLYPKGNDTLRELFVFFESEKITIPSYRTLQDLFTQIFKMERLRLDAIISKIPENLKNELDEIIKNDNGLTELNVIRMDQKDFSYSALKLEVKKAEKIKKLYWLCKTLIPSLQISNNAVRYYASLVEQYPAFRLRKLKKPQQWLQMLCFIFNRYQEFMNNLITTFTFHMRGFMAESDAYADEKECEFIQSVIRELPGAGQFFTWFSSSKNKEEKPNITVEEFKKIGFDIFSQKKQLAFVELICGSGFNKKSVKWDCYEKESRRIALYFRPILLAVDFEFYKKDAFIVELIQSVRDHYSSNKHHEKLSQSISSDVIKKIPKKAMDLLKSSHDSNEINSSRLEFYLYEKMNHQINRGRLYCNDSISYCSLDYDLVPDAMVDNAEEICDGFGYKKIPIYCDERLDQALDELENAWVRTNQNINDGSNKGIKLEVDELGVTTWKLTYDADPKESSTFFDELPKQEIADIIKFMGDHIKIWILFESLKDRYIKHKRPNSLALIACILADAFGFGIEKMAHIIQIMVLCMSMLKMVRFASIQW